MRQFRNDSPVYLKYFSIEEKEKTYKVSLGKHPDYRTRSSILIPKLWVISMHSDHIVIKGYWEAEIILKLKHQKQVLTDWIIKKPAGVQAKVKSEIPRMIVMIETIGTRAEVIKQLQDAIYQVEKVSTINNPGVGGDVGTTTETKTLRVRIKWKE